MNQTQTRSLRKKVLPRVLERREEILTKLKKYYPAVLLDLEVRG